MNRITVWQLLYDADVPCDIANHGNTSPAEYLRKAERVIDQCCRTIWDSIDQKRKNALYPAMLSYLRATLDEIEAYIDGDIE